MEELTLSWVAAAMRARIVGAGPSVIQTICIDSRQAQPGALFFALKGERADGHTFVPDALSRGAAVVVAEGSGTGTGTGTGGIQLVVDDPLKALGELARAYRCLFAAKVVGITGSVGKTSTKEMTAHILRSRFPTLANEKNYNTEIGVPLTLFGLNRTHEAAVVEMGMRAAGEIRSLAEIAQPNIAVITNIGHAHEELLGSQEAIAEAKAELLEHLPPGGIAVLPDDLAHPGIFRSKLPAGCRMIRVGARSADVWSDQSKIDPLSGRTTFRVHLRGAAESADIRIQAPGAHHRSNALLAIATACQLGVTLDQAASALETWSGAEGRMTVRTGLRNVTVLDDCYNAGPESMKAALETLHAFLGRRVAVLGEMRELGALASELHTMVGRYTAKADLTLLITVGPLAEAIADSALAEIHKTSKTERLEVVRFESTEDCEHQIDDLVRPGDVVLVKGSRALEMERIVARLMGEQVSDHHG